MAVLRIKHQENYVTISKLVLEDPDLSFKAKGLWAYCMSRPNEWVFHVSHLATISTDKEDKIYSAIKELESAGYVQKIQKNIGGKFGPVDYVISENKIKNTSIKESLPLAGFPDAGFPDAGNPVLISNDSKQVMIRNTHTLNPSKEEPDKPAPSVGENFNDKVSFGEHGNCKLSLEEYQKLINQLGKEKTEEWLVIIDLEYEKQGAKSFNKKYKSHYATILSWKRLQDKKTLSVGFQNNHTDRRTRDKNGELVVTGLEDVF